MAAAQKDGRLRCTIKGTKHRDVLRGTQGRNVICARGGDDTIRARGGDDYVFGDAGDDRIAGGAGSDHLLGGPGDDRVTDDAGADYLYGELGNDRLVAGRGPDVLYGDLGDDVHDGGSGDNHISGGPGADQGDPYDLGGAGDCPSTSAECEFHLHLDVPFTSYCPSFSVSVGNCFGATPYANPGWIVGFMNLSAGIYGNFAWLPGPGHKITNYGAVQGFVPTGLLMGWVPSPNAPEFAIDDAWSVGEPGIRYYTPLSGRPGQHNGPLYLNFVNGYIGADMYIDGYLVRK